MVPLTTLLRPGHMISNFTSFLVKRMVKPSAGYYSYRHSPEDVQGDRRLVALSERFGTPGLGEGCDPQRVLKASAMLSVNPDGWDASSPMKYHYVPYGFV